MLQILNFLKRIFPFLITIALWRLATPFWNPVGILALIPIFYYTFVKEMSGFGFIGLLICFLIDYKSTTPLFWTSLFCLFYAVNGFQNIINIQKIDNNAFYIFLTFIGIGLLLLTLIGMSWAIFFSNLLLFIWMAIIYIPLTTISNRIEQ